MPPTIMSRESIDRCARTPHSVARLSASVLSHHNLSSAVFITVLAESDFRYIQASGALVWLGTSGEGADGGRHGRCGNRHPGAARPAALGPLPHFSGGCAGDHVDFGRTGGCLLYTSPSPRD